MDRKKKFGSGNSFKHAVSFRKARQKRENRELKMITQQQDGAEALDKSTLKKFADFPLSNRTFKGLEKANYIEPTEIQRDSIPLALSKKDILGAAKTGSGKTLAFLIPVLETLWKERFSSHDGLGALIISPTRELAYQTYEVLRKIGCFHDMSAGLVIGGKDLKSEQQRVLSTNIIICTPGRLLQHMDETPNFACDNLKILVLDEADRILDLGFAQTMNSIIENLPSERQTLLFSATQTKSVKDLARLSLCRPSYVSAHEDAEYITPQKLAQSYVVCELHQKLNFLFSFLRNHTKSKILIFMSSCKQVKFIYEAFRKLRPGIPLIALYGKQKQLRRVAIYEDFCKRSSAALFATDIAARGLDFPGINWVIQLDCPEDVNTYIHRAGRTARYEKDGQALLVLLPSEERGMVKDLKARKIPIEEIKTNPKKLQDIQKKLAAICAESQEMKHWAQRSIVSYVRSVFLYSNKNVFDVHQLDTEQFASSLGLLAPPRIRFMKKLEKRINNSREKEKDQLVNTIMKGMGMKDVMELKDDVSSDPYKNKKNASEKRKQKVEKKGLQLEEDDDEDDVLVVKERHVFEGTPDFDVDFELEDPPLEDEKLKKEKTLSKTALAKKIVRKGIKLNRKVIFDENGEPVEMSGVSLDMDEALVAVEPVSLSESKNVELSGIDIEEHRELMRSEDKLDRKRERDRVKQMHKKQRRKSKLKRKAAAMGVTTAELATIEPIQDESKDDNQASSSEEGESDEETQKHLEESTIRKMDAPPSKKRKKEKIESSPIRDEAINKQDANRLSDDEELALMLLGAPS